MNDQRSGPPEAPSRLKTWVVIAVVAGMLLWLSFASKIPTPSNEAKQSEATSEHTDAPPHKALRVGERAVVASVFVACKDRSAIGKIKSLAIEGDREAAAKYAHQQSCTALDKGDVVMVEAVSLWSGTTCIRKDGEPECYWFPTPFLEASDQSSDDRSNRKPSGYATGGTYACADFEDIKALYEAITSGSSSPADIFTKATRACIKMSDGWPVFILETTDDGDYARIESPGNFEGQLWTSSLSITSGNRD